MPGNYTHTTRASGTILTASIYNGDHENHVTHADPNGLGSGVASVADLRATEAIGARDAETIPTTLEQRLRQIQGVIKEINVSNGADSADQWYEVPPAE